MSEEETTKRVPELVKPDNVILVVIDNLRKDGLGFFGSNHKTPVLDELCSKGVAFGNCFTCSNHTAPSVASILTSTYPFKHKLRTGGFKLDSDLPLISEIIQDENFTTGAVVAESALSRTKGFSRGFDYFSDYTFATRLRNFGNEKFNLSRLIIYLMQKLKIMQHIRSDHKVNKNVKKILNKIRGNNFFMVVNYGGVHEKTLDKPVKNLEEEKLDIRKERNITRFRKRQLNAEEAVRNLIKILKSENLFENTLLVITSDHGESLYENPSKEIQIDYDIFLEDKTYKGHGFSLYDPEINVPLIFYWKGLKHQLIEETVRTVDIFPTILGILGIEKPAAIDGVDLFNDNISSLESYSEMPYINGDLKCIRTNKHKFIWSDRGHLELYDIINDPLEKSNLKDDTKLVNYFKKKSMDILTDFNQKPIEKAEIPEEVRKELIALGYMKDE